MPEQEISEFGRGRHAIPISPSYIRWKRGRIYQVGLMTRRYLLYSSDGNPGLACDFGSSNVFEFWRSCGAHIGIRRSSFVSVVSVLCDVGEQASSLLVRYAGEC